MFKKILLALSFFYLCLPASADDLENVSVCVVLPSGHGSGVLKTRKINNYNISYVWTVAHMLDDDIKINKKTNKPEYPPIIVEQNFTVGNNVLNKHSAEAEVVSYDKKEDLLLLRIKKENFSNFSAKIYTANKFLPIKTDIWNVNYFIGQGTSPVHTKGIMSNHAYKLEENIYDCVTIPIAAGCSGSGIFSEDKLVGLLARGREGIWALSIPIDRMLRWADKNEVRWALDDSVEIPDGVEGKKISFEDIKVVPTDPKVK